MTGKERVAREAVKEVKNHMILGLGSGSTVEYFIEALSEKIREENLEITEENIFTVVIVSFVT